jgi:methionyl-tRNA formyltransferase
LSEHCADGEEEAMDDGVEPRAASWRVVHFTDLGGQIVPLVLGELERHGHRLVGVVTGPGPRRRRNDAYLEVVREVPRGIDVLVTTHMGRLAAMLEPMRPDLILVSAFLWRLPSDVLRLPPLGVINLHGGLLPDWRGPNAWGWAFRAGDPALGFTVHRMDEGLDTGPVLARSLVPIGDDDDIDTLIPRLVATVPEVLSRAFAGVAAGDPGEPQDESRAGYAPLFTNDWREIDWARPARTVHNQVRSWIGARGTPRGAFGVIDGQRVLVTKTRLVGDAATALAAGATQHRDDGTLLVGCGDRPLAILAWTPAVADERDTSTTTANTPS